MCLRNLVFTIVLFIKRVTALRVGPVEIRCLIFKIIMSVRCNDNILFINIKDHFQMSY